MKKPQKLKGENEAKKILNLLSSAHVARPNLIFGRIMALSKKRKRIHLFLILFWGIIFVWMFWQMQPKGVPAEVYISTSSTDVQRIGSSYYFFPVDSASTTGILFYPGALVPPEAYAPFARTLAESGFPVFIQKIPLNLAFTQKMEQTAYHRSVEFMDEHPGIQRWVIAGHSKGGAMAAQFAYQYSNLIAGILLIGTSHPRKTDLSGLTFPVLKVYASEDGLASVEEVKQFSVNLPDHTTYTLVEGGNHSQFGYYGFQLGSGTASISREEQQRQLSRASLEFLNSIDQQQ